MKLSFGQIDTQTRRGGQRPKFLVDKIIPQKWLNTSAFECIPGYVQFDQTLHRWWDRVFLNLGRSFPVFSRLDFLRVEEHSKFDVDAGLTCKWQQKSIKVVKL